MYIVAETTLFSEESGGRHCMPSDSGYCPYLSFDDSGEVVAVRFIDVPKSAKPLIPFVHKIQILYPSEVILRVGLFFKVSEGKKIVGTGKVIST